MRIPVIVALIGGALSTVPLSAQQVGNPEPAAACVASDTQLLAEIRAVHEKQRNVGVSAAIARDGELVYVGHLGFADLEHRVEMSADTRVGIASITKGFTGVALLAAVAAGLIDLDAPIQRYVPEFPEKEGGTVTPRLLMAHLGGIRHWKHGERTPELYATHMTDVMEILPLFANDPLVSPPGESYQYSSHSYNLLAMAIQTATETPFQEYVRREVIRPLGLSATDFDDVQAIVPNRARRYSYYHPVTYEGDDERLYRVPTWDYSHNMGGGNMIASAPDLARFGAALTRPGLLPEPAFELLYTPNAAGETTSPWSAGFFYRPAGESPERIHITGANAGIQAALYVYPEASLAVAVLSNAWGIGSRSGDMVIALPERLAEGCLGW